MTTELSSISLVTLNPQIYGFLDIENSAQSMFIFLNSQRRISVELDAHTSMQVLQQAAKPIPLAALELELCQQCYITQDAARKYLHELIDSEVLVNADKATSTIWERYSRKEARLFYDLSRDQNFLDEQAKELSSAVRADTLKSYGLNEPAPAAFKRMAGARVKLPRMAVPKRNDLAKLLLNRKTIRMFVPEAISLSELSGLLELSLGRTRTQRLSYESDLKLDSRVYLRSMFCAFELYVFIHRVQGLEPGVYHYDIEKHELVLIQTGATEDKVFQFIWGQPMARKAAVSFFASAVFERYAWRYRYSKAYANLLMSLGELGQALVLGASAYNLGACMTPALRDESVDEFIGLDRTKEQAMYFIGVGKFDRKTSQVVS